jgi:hypothetical protein
MKPKGKAPPSLKRFEKSGKDVEPRGMKEGSPQEEAYDRRQAASLGFHKGGKATSRRSS